MSSKLQNSIWPNINGNLGNIKAQIPDGVTTLWPEGDALVHNFVYQNGKIVGFVDTKALIVNDSKSTTIPYDYVNIELPFAEDAMTINREPRNKYLFIKFNDMEAEEGETFDFVIIDFNTTDQETIDTIRTAKRVVDNRVYDVDDNLIGTIDTSKIEVGGIMDVEAMKADALFCNMDIMTMGMRGFTLSEFNSDLSSLVDGTIMFYCCNNLTSFTSNLSSLMYGMTMFMNCENLTSFNADLSSLTNGDSMFNQCSNLTTFSSNLSSLTNGSEMFNWCENLTSFNADLSSLKEANYMFSNCKNLTTFSSNLSSLTNGSNMFYRCPNLTSFNSDLSSLTDGSNMFNNCTNLTTFSSNLSSLTNGWAMFQECKLDAPSIKNIIDTINTYSGSLLDIAMGCNNTTADADLFAQEVGYADMTSLLAALQAKGWDVRFQYNGRPTTTYGLRRPTEDTLPVFVKLEEVETDADYTSEDGSKKFRLNYFHETTGSTEGYTQFNSIEEAVETLNIIPIERN